jgi:hypothetical protein
MRDAGFVDVVARHFYWPLNTWPQDKEEKLGVVSGHLFV